MNNTLLIETIKKDIAKLHTLITAISVVWPSAHLQIIEVLLQNMAFHSPDSMGYNVKDELKRVYDIQKALIAIQKYNSYHLTDFIVEEIDVIIYGARMMQECEETDESFIGTGFID